MVDPAHQLNRLLGPRPTALHSAAPAVPLGGGVWSIAPGPLLGALEGVGAVLVHAGGAPLSVGPVGAVRPFAAGDVLTLGGGAPVELTASGDATVVAVAFDETLLRSSALPWLAREPGHYELLTAQVHDAPTLTALARTLLDELGTGRDGRTGCRAALLLAIVEGVAAEPRLVRRSSAGSAFVEGCIARALRLIDHDVGGDLSLPRIAAHVGISPYHLSRSFRIAMDENIAGYIRRRRVEAACRLLAQSRKSLADVAFECGYSSQSAMNATFRKLLGVTPLDYRRRCWTPPVAAAGT
jgi:AraC-like DNA-binding protein